MIIGDVTVNPAGDRAGLGVCLRYGSGPAVQTRKQMIERAETEDALLIACRFPHLGTGGSYVWRDVATGGEDIGGCGIKLFSSIMGLATLGRHDRCPRAPDQGEKPARSLCPDTQQSMRRAMDGLFELLAG